jgi:protein phosphatase 1 regulatory subunit 37
MISPDEDITDPLRASVSSDEDYHDVENVSDFQALDSLVLIADKEHPVPTETSCEETMVFGDNSDSDEPSNNKTAKKKVEFKTDDSLAVLFPTGRLWEPDPNEMAVDMIELYNEACALERIKPIQKLLEQLERLDDLNTPIDTLDLAGVRLDHRTCETLEMVLGRLCMTCLDIQKSGVEDDGMIAICEMIEYYECVSRLNIAHNSKLKSRAWLSLGRMLKNSPFIDMLNVSYCGLDDQGLTLLLRSVRANCALRTLYIDGNSLSGKGSFILMAAMKFNENLQELHIANNNLLPEDAMNIGGILRTNHTLRVLDMRDNYIQDVGLRHVCVGLAEQQHGLHSLNISNNSFTPMGMEHLAAMLPCTRSLQEINVGSNRVGDSGVIQLKLSLLVNQSVTKIVLVNTRITCEGAIAVAEILAENKNLRQLDLRDNDIRVAGLMALSLAHKMNHRLTQLDVPKAIKSDQRDKAMIMDLLRDIEASTLRNIQEKEKEDASVKLKGGDEVEAPLSESGEMEKVELPSTLDVSEEQEEREEQVDPFEAVAPVVGDGSKVDERRLDAVVIFEHQIEEHSSSPDDESNRTSPPMDVQEPSDNVLGDTPQDLPDLLDQANSRVTSCEDKDKEADLDQHSPDDLPLRSTHAPDVTDQLTLDVASHTGSVSTTDTPDVTSHLDQQSGRADTVDLLSEGVHVVIYVWLWRFVS